MLHYKNNCEVFFMISYLIRKFIPDYENVTNSRIREKYGRLTSITGVLANIFLFAVKFITGILVNSVSIRADAINNLSDAGSSIISLISFKLSNKPADKEHPFGHARYETIASLIVAALILLLGLDLIRGSWQKIISPDAITFSFVSLGVLSLSIVVKFWMYSYNKKYAKILKSSIMDATAADSISDVMATGAVLISTILSPILQFQLDGYMGIVVALFIMKTGYDIVRDALSDLLGKAPDEGLVSNLQNKIYDYPGVLGIHDLIVHNYGPQRTFASVHVEVDGNENVFLSHDMIDNIERDIHKEFDISLVVHMDPINTDDELTKTLKTYMETIVQTIHKEMTIHDFRVVSGDTHTNLIFDIAMPYDIKEDEQDIYQFIKYKVEQDHPDYYLVVTFDRSMV